MKNNTIPNIRKSKNMLWFLLLVISFTGAGASLVPEQSYAQGTVPDGSSATMLYLPLAVSAPAPDQLPENPLPGTPGRNVCPEGHFWDLSNAIGPVCRLLDVPEYGFNLERFLDETDTSTVFEIECSEDSLDAALAQAEGVGGTVQIPACTFAVGRVNIPSGVIIQGAGVDQTIITGSGCPTDDSPKRIFFANEVSNVVVRDMTFDAQNENCSMLSTEYSDNVLFERVAVRNGPTSAITFRKGVKNVTIRYSEMSNQATFHGINSKDCASGATVADCPESEWSRSYSIYSNVMTGNSLHGMNIHAFEGEIAGNLSFANGYGGKLYDGQCLWVHHNQYANNTEWGLFVAPTLNIAERVPHDLYFYKNQFIGTPADSWSWGITPGGESAAHPIASYTNIYVMDNVMDGRLKTDGVPLDFCPGTFEASLDVEPSQEGDAAVCNLPAYPSMGGTALPFAACGVGTQ